MNGEPDAHRHGLALAFGAALISGVAVFVNGYGVRAAPDATVYTTAKNLVAAALLLTVVGAASASRAKGGVPLRRRPTVLAGLLAVAVVGGSVPFVLFFEGLARASSTHAAFVHKTLFVWVAVLAVPLLGERLRWPYVAAFTMLLAGVVMLDGGLGGFRFGVGEWLILAATLLWAVEVVLAKRLLRVVAPRRLAVARMGLGVLLLLGWLTVTGRLDGLAAMGVAGWQWAALTGVVLAAYVTTWFTALVYAPAVDVAAVLVVGAVVTGVLSALLKGAAVPAPQVAGMVLLLSGAAVLAAAAGRQPAWAATAR